MSKKCVYCGGVVFGEIKSVKPTLCCAPCCMKVSKLYPGRHFYGEKHCVGEAYAETELGCCSASLKEVNHGWTITDITERGTVQYAKYFILAEVVYLVKRDRLESLEEAAHMQFSTVDSVMRCFLLNDYIQDPLCKQSWQKQFEAAFRRCEVLDHVMQILQSVKGAHPQAVIRFCAENPEKGVKEFQELKEKVRCVFRLEGTRILSMLSKRDRKRLIGTPLEDTYKDFVKHKSRSLP